MLFGHAARRPGGTGTPRMARSPSGGRMMGSGELVAAVSGRTRPPGIQPAGHGPASVSRRLRSAGSGSFRT